MRYHDLTGDSFRLPHVLVPLQLRGKIQGGVAKLLILPLHPQPAGAGAEHVQASAGDQLADVQNAFVLGRIPPPIPVGYAFEIRTEDGPEKYRKIGTGIVAEVVITRLQYITNSHLARAGYTTVDDLRRYWHQAAGDLGKSFDPWCWLIDFNFKG